MRSRVVALIVGVLVALCGCDARYGTYLRVDGAVEFDRVEFFFGADAGEAVPSTPTFQPPPNLLQHLFRRQLDPTSDVQVLASTSSSLDFYLPDRDANLKLGDHVVVLAYRGDQLVGIGEHGGFEVTADREVRIYTIELQPSSGQDIERWGVGKATNDCLRWTRDAVTIAVTRGDDTDCDGFVDAGIDCTPLAYCDGIGAAGCPGPTPCVEPAMGCALGSCRNQAGAVPRTCAPATCLATGICAACDLSAPADEALACVLDTPASHSGTDSPFPVTDDRQLCADPYSVLVQLDNGLECTDPKVEAVRQYERDPPSPVDATVMSAGGGVCKLSFTPHAPGATLDSYIHVLISLDTGRALRTGIVVGFEPIRGLCGGAMMTAMPMTIIDGCL